MTTQMKPVPPGFHTVTPMLTVREADKAIDFYKRAFGAEERMRFLGPDEKEHHARRNQNRRFDHLSQR